MPQSSLLDAFSAVSGLGNEVVSDIDNKLRVEAETKLKGMALQYQQNENDFLMKLQDSNDYENWQSRADNFLQKQSDSMQADAGNQYTSVLAKQMMESSRAGLMGRVQSAAHDGIIKDTITTSQQNKTQITNMYQGQQRLDLLNAEDETLYKNGMIDRQTYAENVENNVVQTAYDAKTKLWSDYTALALQQHKDEAWVASQVDAAYKNQGLSVSMLKEGAANPNGYMDRDDMTGAYSGTVLQDVDKKTSANGIMSYKASLQDAQDKNAETLSQIYNKMCQVEEGPRREQYRAQGRAAMRGMSPGWELNRGVYDSFSSTFAPHKDTGSSSGSGSGISSFETYMNRELENKVQAARLGRNSGRPGLETLNGASDVFMSGFNDIADRYGLTDDDKAYEKDKYFNKLFDRAGEVFGHDPQVMSTLSNLKDYAKQLAKDKGGDKDAIFNEAASYMMQAVYDTDVSNLDKKSFTTDVEKHMRMWTCEELDIQRMTKDGKSKYNGNLSKGVKQLAENDVAYTDAYGRTIYAPGVKETVENVLAPKSRQALEKAGIDTSHLTFTAEKGTKHDVDISLQWKDNITGDAYEFVPGGKNSYKILKNGQEYASGKDESGFTRFFKYGVEDAKAGIDSIKQRAENSRETSDMLSGRDTVMSYDIPNDGTMTRDAWSKMDAEGRKKYLAEWKKKDADKYGSYERNQLYKTVGGGVQF